MSVRDWSEPGDGERGGEERVATDGSIHCAVGREVAVSDRTELDVGIACQRQRQIQSLRLTTFSNSLLDRVSFLIYFMLIFNETKEKNVYGNFKDRQT